MLRLLAIALLAAAAPTAAPAAALPAAAAAAPVGPPPCEVPARAVRLPSRGVKLGVVSPLAPYAEAGSRCSQARLVVQTGARIVREPIEWARVSPRRGEYRWDEIDAVFVTTAQQGLTVLPLLLDAPGWARPAANGLPRDRAAFARFAAAVARRYGPRGTFWAAHASLPVRPATWIELFNEVYLPPGRPDPAAYARLVREAVTAARRANPRTRYLISADTTWLDENHHIAGDWLPALYAAVPGFGRYFDGVAAHPYSTRPPATAGSYDGSRELNRRVEDIHAALARLGDGAKKLWVTEIGWSTCAKRPNCVTEEQQARYLTGFVRLARTRWRRFTDTVIVYALHTLNGTDAVQNDFGLLRRDGSRKPGWSAFRAAALEAFR